MEALNFAVGGLVTGGIYALLAIGFTMVFSVSGILNLAQGAFVTMGALLTYSLINNAHLPVALAILGALVMLTVFAGLVEWVIIRPALNRLSHTSLLMLMGGFLILFEGLAFIIWGSNPYSLSPFTGAQPVHVGSVFVPTQSFWIAGTVVVVVVGVWWLLTKTSFGRALQACSENPTAATLMGIPVQRMILFSFAVSGGIGVLAGAVIAPITSLDYGSMFNYTNQGLIAVTVGGMGNFFGSLVGGLTLGVVEEFLSGYISSLFSTTLSLLVLLAILVWLPQGILGRSRGSRADIQERGIGRGFMPPRLSRRTTVTLAVLGLIFLAVIPFWLAPTGLLHAVNITGIFCLTIIGLDLLTGVAGQVSLGQAGFMAIGGYTSAILATKYHLSPILGVCGGIVLSLAVAFILSLASSRVRGMYLAISTLAFGILIESLGNGMSSLTGGPSGLIGIPSFSVGGFVFSTDTQMYFLIWGLVVLALILFAGLMRSHRGRAWRTMQIDETGAQALGVNVVASKIHVFLLSAALASIAGSLYAFYFHYLSPDMVGSQASLDIMTMLVIGGVGTLIGPLIGVVILTFLPQMSQSMSNWKLLFEGVLLVVFLRYLPGGIYGFFLQAMARLTNRTPRQPLAEERR